MTAVQGSQPTPANRLQSMDVALNVARARITVLGFALALCLFASSTLLSIGQAYHFSAVWVFLPSFVSLSLGFSLTLIALLLFVGALRLDQGGAGRIWPFSFGEILMYLALSQVLAGGFQYLATGLLFVFHNVPQRTLLDPEQLQLLMPMAEQLTFWLTLCAGVGWLASIYAAPIYFLIRNPLPWGRKWLLAVAYFVLLIIISWISAIPYRLHARAAGKPEHLAVYFAGQFAQPLLWITQEPIFSEPTDRR